MPKQLQPSNAPYEAFHLVLREDWIWLHPCVYVCGCMLTGRRVSVKQIGTILLQLTRTQKLGTNNKAVIKKKHKKRKTQPSNSKTTPSFKSFKCLKPGKGMPQRRVLRVWRLANGRLERPKNRGLCAGKGQAATPGTAKARGLGGSGREGSGGF